MCMSRPAIAAPRPPSQEVKAPDSLSGAGAKRKPAGMGGTVLTGTTGVARTSLNTGGNTLLGG